MLHTHEVTGSSPVVSTKKDSQPFGWLSFFVSPLGLEPIKCKAPVEPCSLRSSPQRHIDLIESCCLCLIYSAKLFLNNSGPRAIQVCAFLTRYGKVRRKTADHIITFVTAAFNIWIHSITRTVFPLIAGDQCGSGNVDNHMYHPPCAYCSKYALQMQCIFLKHSAVR